MYAMAIRSERRFAIAIRTAIGRLHRADVVKANRAEPLQDPYLHLTD